MISVVAYGGGTNSTALLVGLWELGERPDLILFADTGGEKPHTYEYILVLNQWLKSKGFPEIVTVRHRDMMGREMTLEERCLENKALPSIVMGRKSCSDKHKIRPQNTYLRNWQPAIDAWARGEQVVKLIGYDADEGYRARDFDDKRYLPRYPLIEWDWGRDEYIEAIARAGLPQPGKSACFFCPSSKKHEILELADRYPELADRAIALEKNAQLHTVKGLGRSWAWGDLIASDRAQFDMFEDNTIGAPCGCYDG